MLSQVNKEEEKEMHEAITAYYQKLSRTGFEHTGKKIYSPAGIEILIIELLS